MKAKKSRSDKAARIVFALVGVFLLLISAHNICLYYFGVETKVYDLKVTRLGSKGDSDVDTKWRFSLSYSYMVDGVEYDGLDTSIRGPWLGPKHDMTVHYYRFAPRISSLFAEDAAGAKVLILIGFGLALFLVAVVPRKKKRTEKVPDLGYGTAPNAQVQEADFDSDTPVTMAWLMEHTDGYSDKLEKYYQNGWDKNDPSWKCECGKWNTENFCEACGRQRK